MENFEKCAKRKRKKHFISLHCPKPKLLVKAVNTWVRSAFGNVFCHGSVSFQGGAGLAEVQGGEALVVVSSENFKK